MNTYSPRRCGKRWLDGDCPTEILAIIEAAPSDPAPERYDVIYAEIQRYEGYGEWLNGFSLTEYGTGSHFELKTHEATAYRYRMKHRYTKWSTLPDVVKAAIRDDIKKGKEL